MSSFEGAGSGARTPGRPSLGRQSTAKGSQLIMSRKTSIFPPDLEHMAIGMIEEEGGSIMDGSPASPGLRRNQMVGHHNRKN